MPWPSGIITPDREPREGIADPAGDVVRVQVHRECVAAVRRSDLLGVRDKWKAVIWRWHLLAWSDQSACMILERADQAAARLVVVGCNAFRRRPVIDECHAVPPLRAINLSRSQAVAHPVALSGDVDGEIPAAIEVFGFGWPLESERPDRVGSIEDHQILQLLLVARRRLACLRLRPCFLAWPVVPGKLLAPPQPGQRSEQNRSSAA